MDDLLPARLRALGLTDGQAAVLAAVAAEGDTTTPGIVGRTGLGRATVSTALEALEQLGLVQRDHGRRPEPVRLAADLPDAAAALVQRRDDEQVRALLQARAAAAALAAALERRGTRPRPDVRRVEPDALGPSWRRATARRTLEVVARPADPEVVFGGDIGRPGRRDRLLVTGRPREVHVAVHRARGVDVRSTDEELPALVVVDGLRARVDVAADGRGGRSGWTEDRPQVAALQRLFELWWAEAA